MANSKWFIPWAIPQTSAAGDRRCAPIGGPPSAWETTEANVYGICPIAGTLTSMYVITDVAPGTPASGKSYAFKYRVEIADTALSVTVADDATTGSSSAEVAVAAGDRISFIAKPTGTPAALRVSSICEFRPTTSGQTVLGMSNTAGVNIGAATNYGGLLGVASFSTTESQRYMVMPCAGTIKHLWVRLNTGVGAGNTRTFDVSINGSSVGSPAVTFSDGDADTKGDATTEIAVVAGDTVSIRHTLTGTPTASIAAWGLGFIPDTPGDFVIVARPSMPSGTDTRYVGACGAQGATSTEGETQTIGRSDYTLKAAYIKTSAAVGGGKSYDINFREDGAPCPTTFNMNISGAAQTTDNVTGENFTPGDNSLYDWEIVAAGTPTVPNATISLLGHFDNDQPITGSTIYITGRKKRKPSLMGTTLVWRGAWIICIWLLSAQ